MTAYFVLSTGRCGTQWLAETLQLWSDNFVVRHEPLHFQYRPDLNSPSAPPDAQCRAAQGAFGLYPATNR
jgi:hypothetical protein